MPDQNLTAGQLMLAEYEELKAEQRARIATRDNLGYATWAGVGLVLAAARFGPTIPTLWLGLPVVVIVLGWTRLQNDIKISRIGQYIRTDLAPRATALAGTAAFGWESAHNAPGTRHQLRMVCQLVADLVMYAAAPAAALVVYGTVALWSPLVAVAVLEAFAVAGLASMITLYSGVRIRGRDIAAESSGDGAR